MYDQIDGGESRKVEKQVHIMQEMTIPGNKQFQRYSKPGEQLQLRTT